MQIFTKTRHVGEDVLGLHAMNDLPESGRPQVEAHLQTCRNCRDQFTEIQEFVTLLRMAARCSSTALLQVVH